MNAFDARAQLEFPEGPAVIYRPGALEQKGIGRLDRLPFSIRVLLENALRHAGRGVVTDEHVTALANWHADGSAPGEIPFMPARVVLQDFTGVPCVVDLVAMRDAMARLGGDAARINPVVPCDLVIDHSVQVDHYGTPQAFRQNVALEFERNAERYQLLKFAQRAFDDFRVVPPGTGIVHQVNLEYLAPVVQLRQQGGALTAYPDTLVGTDSHTTMINGLGVLGWGVGGIEAEAVMLGQPYFMLIPEVVGVKLTGELPLGTTATDLVLTVTQLLRKQGVVDKFVEFYGPGLSRLGVADRATIANMAPEYGATVGFFPVDAETVSYLQRTGRAREAERTERYHKEIGGFRTDQTPDPEFTVSLALDLGTLSPSLAGPRRPQDLVPLADLKKNFAISLPGLMPPATPVARRSVAEKNYSTWVGEGGAAGTAGMVAAEGAAAVAVAEPELPWWQRDKDFRLDDGAVVIAAITSCTNTSNPSVMVGAGLLARKAIERGLTTKPWVKTSMAPGSRVVQGYLEASGLLPYLERLGFNIVGFGCTTCIGNSGPLPEKVAETIESEQLVAAAVLSGNRNFEARIHPQVRANYLASPMLVVAFALAGCVCIDLTTEPLGTGKDGKPVFLKDIWPTLDEIKQTMAASLKPELFTERYASVFDGDAEWRGLQVPAGDRFEWVPDSTYIREPPYFTGLSARVPDRLADLQGVRVLASLGDSVTTDHISPAGSIPKNGPAARYLLEHNVQQVDWNTFGARRGNHEVMMRGTFGNVRIKNRLVPEQEGNWTVHLPSGEVLSIYDAAQRYLAEGTPLLILAGKEYGTGSSRDWAAKGTTLLGVKAVLAESYERIHRSNLVGMGVLPLGYVAGQSREVLGLTGREVYSISGIASGLVPGGKVRVKAVAEDGKAIEFEAVVRLNSAVELEYLKHGGILPRVLRKFLEK
ncbi:MAG TPA: aconitate hydratase AcnA [Gemmatimonadales bacterium]|nr:aconitate hydratase AcnA [Gemmatimonadales bacterium]